MKKIAQWILLALAVGFIPAMVLGYSVFAVSKWRKSVELQEVGISVQGVVLNSEESGFIRGRAYKVTVQYPNPMGSDSLVAEISVDESTYNILPKGAHYRVLVDPNDNLCIDLPGNRDYVEDLTYAGIGIFLLLIGIIALVRMFRRGLFRES